MVITAGLIVVALFLLMRRLWRWVRRGGRARALVIYRTQIDRPKGLEHLGPMQVVFVDEPSLPLIEAEPTPEWELTPTREAKNYVHIEADGSARELDEHEQRHIEQRYHYADGDRPYVKQTYDQRTPDDRIWGYLDRSALPEGMTVVSADQGRLSPVDDPWRAQLAEAERQAELRRRRKRRSVFRLG